MGDYLLMIRSNLKALSQSKTSVPEVLREINIWHRHLKPDWPYYTWMSRKDSYFNHVPTLRSPPQHQGRRSTKCSWWNKYFRLRRSGSTGPSGSAGWGTVLQLGTDADVVAGIEAASQRGTVNAGWGAPAPYRPNKGFNRAARKVGSDASIRGFLGCLCLSHAASMTTLRRLLESGRWAARIVASKNGSEASIWSNYVCSVRVYKSDSKLALRSTSVQVSRQTVRAKTLGSK